MKHSILALCCLILLGCQSSENNTKTPFDQVRVFIDQYGNDAIKKGNLDALAVSVYRDGKTYYNYYGELEKNKGNTPNDSTLFEIASVSKVFLGSLVAKAVLEERINLDDDIRKYLKGDYPNLEFNGTPISVKNLVTHTIGFDTPPKLLAIFRKMSTGYFESNPIQYSMDDLFEELKAVQLIHEPGTFYDYSSVGCELAAYVLEQVYDKPYKALLQDFFDDLGMKNSYLLDFDQHRDYLAVSYDENNKIAPLSRNPLLGGSAGIITTLPDLTKFMQFQLESDDPLIKEATKKLYEDDDDNVMGYLWQDLGFGEEEGFFYSKSGDSNGVQSILLICPDSNYAQIIIANNQTEAATNDWVSLYYKIEKDLIKYPKINLKSLLKDDFIKDKVSGKEKFNRLKEQDSIYFNTDLTTALNSVGYDLLYIEKKPQEAIALFQFAIEEAPDNANLYDSLGEAYFVAKDYENARLNYAKSVALNPNNNNAKKYINEIDRVLKK
ncbi:serine hydrolase [Spongiimicrobium salis]|uniref:serine hydrolase n=1 Tax=Spongiimicrobium salis TaxID=1667022 RepID=UPI00374DE1C0